MKYLLAFLMVLPLGAQTIYSGGWSWSFNAAQKMAGTALVAKPAAEKTRVFVVFDAVPTNWRPVIVTTNIGAGVGQQLAAFTLWGRTVSVWAPTTAGVSWSGTSVGWEWSGGLLIDIPTERAEKLGKWGIEPNVRFLKSSVNDNSGYQIIGGVLMRFKGEK